MATIGEEVSKTLVSTNVVDNTDVFDNTVKQNYPKGTKYKEGDSIYQNTGNDIFVTTYDAQGTYAVGDIVFKDSLVKKCVATTGEFPTQPENYPAVDTGFDYTAWLNRYMKFTDLPAGARANETTLDISTYSQITDMTFDSTGTRLYICDNGATPRIYQYNLSVAWDFSTATYVGSKNTQSPSPMGIALSADGTKIYEVSAETWSKIYEYSLSTAYLVSSASYVRQFDLSTGGNSVYAGSLFFRPNGTRFYVADHNYDKVIQYNLGTAWNISTATRSTEVNATTQLTNGICFSSDGTRMYEANDYTGKIHQWNLPVAWDIANPTRNATITLNMTDGFLDGVFMSSDGLNFYCIDRVYDIIRQWISYTPKEINYFQPTMYPVNLYRTVDSRNYKYSILKSGSTYTFQRTDIFNNNTVSQFSPMNVLTSLDNYSVEEVAYSNGVERGQWLAKTLIERDGALYLRSTVNAPIIYVTLTAYQFSTVANASDLPSFTRIGASNPYKAIDGSNISPAISSSPVNYVLRGDEIFNSFTLAKVLADSITYTFKYEVGHSEYDLWFNGVAVTSGGNGIVKTDSRAIDCKRDSKGVLSHYPTTIMLYAGEQMLVDTVNNKFPLVEIDVTRDYGEIQIGDFTLNNAVDAGFTKLNFGHGVQDFNDYTPDAWGAIPEGVKAKVTKFTITTDIFLENYDYAVSFNESISGKFISIDGSDSNGEVSDSLTVFSSLTRRVMVKSITSNSVEKDGEMWRMANVKIAVQEVV